jgi:1-acyl-sn-glycerol-3-phosphate acyltransferase
MGHFFYSLYNLLTRKKLFLVLLLFFFIGLVMLSVSRLKINEDYTSIFPQEKDSEKFNFILKNSSASNKIIVYFSTNDSLNSAKTDSLIKYADVFADSVHFAFADHIRDLKYVVEDEEMKAVYDFLYENLPLFLNEKDYENIEEKLSDSAVRATLQNNYQSLVSPVGIVMKQFLMNDPLHLTGLAYAKLNQIQTGEQFTFEKNRIFSKDRNDLFLFITVKNPGDTKAMKEMVAGFEKEIRSIRNPEIEVNYFGTPVISEANADRIKKDLMLTLSLSILFLLFLLGFYFRNILAPLVLLVPVIAGGALALAMLYLLKGEISAISLGMGSVLLGIGIDFSLHLFTHYKHTGSIKELFNDLSKPIVVGAITTASAFMCLFLIRSPGLQDFGLFAALSVLSTALATLIFLPLILIPAFKKSREKKTIAWISSITSYDFHKNTYLVLIILLLTVVFFYTRRRVTFNENLMDMNYMTEKLKKAEEKISQKTNFTSSSVFMVTTGKNMDEALTNNEKISGTLIQLKNAGIINEYFNVNDLMPSQQQQIEKIKQWKSFWELRKEPMSKTLATEAAAIGFKPGSFSRFYEMVEKDYSPLPAKVFHEISRLFLQDYLIENTDQSAVITLVKTEKANKNQLRKSVSGFDQTYYFDRQEFSERMFGLIKSQFNQLLWYSSILVFMLLLISFGRIELAIVTFIPLLISWIWTIGIMGIFDIRFNFFNLMISTFIFGLGDDYSIFMTEGHLHKLQFKRDNIQTFKRSILLSSFTTVIGIGVLLFAGHPALRSIALVAVIGISSAVVITFTLQPVLINFLTHYQNRKRSQPVTLYNYFFSITSLVYFLIAVLFGAVFIPILKILPIPSKTKKYMIHCVIWFFSLTVSYHNIHVKKTLINRPKGMFKKPVIVISNHQSALDLVLLLMLHPKLVILANTKSWNNPFYGRIIRFAEFIRSDTGLDVALDTIRKRVEDGYSIIVFPEGTRSADCKIKRFHKGAFYLADQLNLEIQPILIHGACQRLNKKEFFLRRGRITLKFFDRINLKDGKYGIEYSEQAKGVLKFMRTEFEIMKRPLEVPDRLKYNLINRYIFRGPVLEWYLRIKLMLEKNYNLINEIVPRKGTITDIGCGYGFMAVMLALTSDKRMITGFDYDEDKIITAQNCTEDLENLKFVSGDVSEKQIPASDVFLLMDVLHYMSENKQADLLKKCFDSLNENGMIVVRDADADLRNRTMGTRITEFFSTKFGFNKTRENLSFVSGQVIRRLATENGFNVKVIDNTKLTSNLIYIIGKNVQSIKN